MTAGYRPVTDESPAEEGGAALETRRASFQGVGSTYRKVQLVKRIKEALFRGIISSTGSNPRVVETRRASHRGIFSPEGGAALETKRATFQGVGSTDKKVPLVDRIKETPFRGIFSSASRHASIVDTRKVPFRGVFSIFSSSRILPVAGSDASAVETKKARNGGTPSEI